MLITKEPATIICCVVLNRAGDTIVLEAGQIHHAHDVVIPWPLKLIGSGADAEDTVVLCSKGPDAALDFRYGMPLLSQHSVCHKQCLTCPMTHLCRHPSKSCSSHIYTHVFVPYEVFQIAEQFMHVEGKTSSVAQLILKGTNSERRLISDSLEFESEWHACRSTGKVTNLTIKATLSNCIMHRRGKLTVESCKLQCYAGGLEHLFTPLVTLATAGLTVQRKHLTRPMLTGMDAGMGVLSVIETRIRVSLLPCASA